MCHGKHTIRALSIDMLCDTVCSHLSFVYNYERYGLLLLLFPSTQTVLPFFHQVQKKTKRKEKTRTHRRYLKEKQKEEEKRIWY